MAVIRDVMPAFQLFQPTSVRDAQKLLEQHGSDAWVIAGGLDSFDWLKDRIKKPKALVDLSGIEELRGVRSTPEGIEIGAMTTLTEVVLDPVIKEKYSLLAEAAAVVASPQIRNQGTLGGNVSQDARCWYYRAGWPCYRAGGNICYADTPVGRNREHAILHAERCVAVNPSDTAPALIALDAKFVVQTPQGEQVIPAEDYFVGPDLDITHMDVDSAFVQADLEDELYVRLHSLLDFLLPEYVSEGEAHLVIAIGCTGGRHRSVAIAEHLAARYRDRDELTVAVAHRDIDKRSRDS